MQAQRLVSSLLEECQNNAFFLVLKNKRDSKIPYKPEKYTVAVKVLIKYVKYGVNHFLTLSGLLPKLFTNTMGYSMLHETIILPNVRALLYGAMFV